MGVEIIIYLIAVPLIAGLLCLLIPKKINWLTQFISVATSIISLFFSIFVYRMPPVRTQFFLLDGLNKFIVPAVALFGVLIVLYSLKSPFYNSYYTFTLWTLSAAFGAVLSNNLILFSIFWGFLALTLYLLIQINGTPNDKSDAASYAAKKTFIVVGGSDCFLLLGIAILWFLTGTFQIDKINIQQLSKLGAVAFLCFAIAAFAKAGAMPLHTWIPDMAVSAPVPVTAFLPASLDKLLGIYLLARVCVNMFKCSESLNVLLMIIGAITIVAAVFMAMIQHDLKKLLSYHAVSQVGYMVLGIGTGNIIGIAGGIFHMLNNAIYKSCLFLCGGSVEYRTGTSDLDKLGGLSKFMPITFISCLIAALSISGVPPFNGFVSKWMVYQGVIQTFQKTNFRIFAWIFLISAMFGSALTLASFMKLIHAIFLGQTPKYKNGQIPKEVPWTMVLPEVILAAVCIIFGIFAFQIPLKYFVFPPVPHFTGIWRPGLATVLILIGLSIGLFIYLVSKLKIRESITFIGGETLPQEVRVSGVDFYQTIKDIGFFKWMYSLAEKKIFDIYDWGKNVVLAISSVLSSVHTGNLHRYLIWCLVGTVILLFVL
jgi:formate hydrogenlyase subunit 3/multisubunit Na+/H+ antiporter MnhD subunit